MKLKIDADVFIFDLDGTVYLGESPIDNAIDTLKRLDADGKKVYFLTNNSSRDKNEYVKKLTSMGYPARTEQVLTSTMAAIFYINTHFEGKTVYPIGTPTFVNELEEAGIKLSEDADIVLLAFDTTLTYEKLWKANILLDNGREYIATHPDIVCPSDIGDMPDTGAIMALFECSTGRRPSVICGKPYAPMAEVVNNLVNTPKERIVMIGDRLYTDIPFGIDNGYQSVLVLSGESTKEMLEESGLQPHYVLDSVEDLYK